MLPIAVVLVTAPACSLFSVVQAPREAVVVTPPRCTRSWVAPVVDSLVTGALVATAAVGVTSDTGAPLLLLGSAFPVSAVVGYHATHRCREINRSPMVAAIGTLDRISTSETQDPVLPSSASEASDSPIAREDTTITTEPAGGDATTPKREDVVPPRLPPPTRPSPTNPIRLPDEVVTRALDTGRPAFLRCFARAQREDPTLTSVKVVLHIEIDPKGTITAVRTDAPAAKFGSCLGAVARGLRFAAPGRDAVVEAPLLF